MGILNKLFGRGKNEYKGELKNGVYHGFGTMNFASGAKYKGDWKNGKMSGKGTFFFREGDKYEGEFKNNQKHG